MQPTILNRFSLRGSTALITGGTGLIGAEVCRVLSDAGASIVIADLRADPGADTATALRLPAGTMWSAYQVDIADPESVARMVTQAEAAHGRIDILINCAAIDAKFDSSGQGVRGAALHDMPIDLWQRSVDVNITGMFLVTRRILQGMLRHGRGNIVNVASVYSLVAPDQRLYGEPDAPSFRPKPVDYVATKSMVPNFTRYIATTYGGQGIRANCIVPHGIETDHAPEFKSRFAARSPLGRMCRLEEIGPPVLFLASDASSYMTGSTLVVDGGWTAW